MINTNLIVAICLIGCRLNALSIAKQEKEKKLLSWKTSNLIGRRRIIGLDIRWYNISIEFLQLNWFVENERKEKQNNKCKVSK